MKRWIGLFFSVSVAAAPIGNPAAPAIIKKGIFSRTSKASVRAGYEGDFVFNGRMEMGRQRVDNFIQMTQSGTATLDILNRWDIYGVFGSSDVKTDWRFINKAGIVNRMEFKSDFNFLWAVGSRVIYYQWKHACLGIGGRYSSSDYQPEHLYQNGISIPAAGAHCHWREWQINADISCRICYFTPYIGIKYSNVRTQLGGFSIPLAPDGSETAYFENKDPVGLHLGCGISSGDYLMINLEGRLIDEEAVSASADVRF